LTPCEICTYPVSQKCHLLDVAAWGENPFTGSFCARCHEMIDMLITTIEKEEPTRATILTQQFREEGLQPEYGEWFQLIEAKARAIAEFRHRALELMLSQSEHLEKHQSSIMDGLSKAKELGVR
jgi:hypothetical protein